MFHISCDVVLHVYCHVSCFSSWCVACVVSSHAACARSCFTDLNANQRMFVTMCYTLLFSTFRSRDGFYTKSSWYKWLFFQGNLRTKTRLTVILRKALYSRKVSCSASSAGGSVSNNKFTCFPACAELAPRTDMFRIQS